MIGQVGISVDLTKKDGHNVPSSVMIVLFYLLMCWFVLTGFLFGLCQNGVSKKRIPLLTPKIIQPFYSKGLRSLCLLFLKKMVLVRNEFRY